MLQLRSTQVLTLLTDRHSDLSGLRQPALQPLPAHRAAAYQEYSGNGNGAAASTALVKQDGSVKDGGCVTIEFWVDCRRGHSCIGIVFTHQETSSYLPGLDGKENLYNQRRCQLWSLDLIVLYAVTASDQHAQRGVMNQEVNYRKYKASWELWREGKKYSHLAIYPFQVDHPVTDDYEEFMVLMKRNICTPHTPRQVRAPAPSEFPSYKANSNLLKLSSSSSPHNLRQISQLQPSQHNCDVWNWKHPSNQLLGSKAVEELVVVDPALPGAGPNNMLRRLSSTVSFSSRWFMKVLPYGIRQIHNIPTMLQQGDYGRTYLLP
ncbi:uncharacterized protein LOC130281955 [Hyla sarda]|uniref:uncharacterized protein LOC130281955 n=1 Tax=Hyla sarda TaxID=327740 RepID=UPI0024C3722D|nr:uncharacterized protein LOC130281955 [Hyla sarda]